MRNDYYKFIKTYSNGINLYNIFNIKWSDFTFPSGYTLHYVSRPETDRPYLISVLYYNDPFYIDDIILVNQLSNFLELRVGVELKIPVLSDLQVFRQNQFLPFEAQFKNELS
jgi:hypothetical protein